MEKPHYKNWIPVKLVTAVLIAALALLLGARLLVETSAALGFVLLLLAFAVLFLGLYLLRARTALDDSGGGVQVRCWTTCCAIWPRRAGTAAARRWTSAAAAGQ